MNKKEMFFDADFRKDPETNLFCAYCQRDLDINKLKYLAFLSFRETPTIFNPKFKETFLKRSVNLYPIGSECAKHLKKEWLIEIKQFANSVKDGVKE